MPRLNKVTEKVFAEIAETPKKKAEYTSFLHIDKIMGLDESESLKGFKEMYYDLVNDNNGTISSLAALEEIIIQLRCKSVVNSEIIVYLSRNYIYARSTFYRRDKEINDIRVLMGKIGDFRDDFKTDKAFRDLCKNKLIRAMDAEIKNNVVKLKTLTEV
jgi:hypothetical protein